MQGQVVVLPEGLVQSAASAAEEGQAPVPADLQKPGSGGIGPGLMSSGAQGGGTVPRRSWKLLPVVLAAVFALAILLPLLGRLRTLHWRDSLAEQTTRTLLVFKQVRI